jgi:hypothetical protein
MTKYKEENLCFDFGPSWDVLPRHDGPSGGTRHPDYDRIQQAGVKTVDFLARRRPDEAAVYFAVYFIEAKERRGGNLKAMALDFMQKFQGALLCCYISQQRYGSRDWDLFLADIANRATTIKLVLWLELGNLPGAAGIAATNRKKAIAQGMQQQIKTMVARWKRDDPKLADPMVIIAGSTSLPDLTVTDLTVSTIPCP